MSLFWGILIDVFNYKTYRYRLYRAFHSFELELRITCIK